MTNGNDRYSHDLEGNQSERQSPTLGNRRTLWDAENRLIAVEDPQNPASRNDFQYDALGRRIGVQDKNNGTLSQDNRLIYCGTVLCAEEDQSTGSFSRYYGDGAAANGQGSYHRDHLGSVRAVTGSTGTVKASYTYDPYGRRTVLTGNAGDSVFGYTGHYIHQATGLALAPYRAYDADIGRWISRDPIGEEGGVNIYAYVGNNPLRYIDPLGLSGQSSSTGYYVPSLPFAVGTPENYALSKALTKALNNVFNQSSAEDDESANCPRDKVNKNKPFPKGGPPRDPKTGNYVPDPEAEGAHTTLGTRQGSNGDYTQGATFDEDGNFTGRTDVTDHGRSDHTDPHFHPALGPNSVGSGIPIP